MMNLPPSAGHDALASDRGGLYMARGRRHSEEFKADPVALVRKSGRPIAQVAKELGVDDSRLSY